MDRGDPAMQTGVPNSATIGYRGKVHLFLGSSLTCGYQ